MRKRFMTYDRDNPPAGVGKDGVFTGGGSGGGGIEFYEVIFDKTDNVWTCNRTYAEVYAAIQAGKVPIGRTSINGNICYYNGVLYFTCCSYPDMEQINFRDMFYNKDYVLYENNTVSGA